MGILLVSVTSLTKFKSAFIHLNSFRNHSKESNNKVTQLKYISYCGVDYKFWNK